MRKMKHFKPLLVIVLSAMILFAVGIPARISADVQDEPHEVSVAILYDESYEKFVEDVVGDDVNDRLDEIMRYASFSFKNTYDIELDYTILSYETAIGTPYSYSGMMTGCYDLWEWEFTNPGGSGPIILHRVWNHYNGQCHCILKDSNCFVDTQTPGHHNSADRVLHDLHSASLSGQYDILVAFVGHRLCYYSQSQSRHKMVAGLTRGGTWNVTVISGIHGKDDPFEYPTEPSFDYHSHNLLSCVRIVQHELSHDFNCIDGNCTSNFPCIMSGGFDGIVYANSIWCTNCSTNYFDVTKFEPMGGE